MEFSLSEDQVAIKDLAKQIIGDRSTDEFLREFAETKEAYDQQLWSLLAEAGLLGLALPSKVGGSDFALLEVCQVLEAIGQYLAPIPYMASVVLAGSSIAEFGNEEQQQRYLEPLASGQTVLTAAVAELAMVEAARPRCVASKTTNGWSISGEKFCVPYAAQASAMLLPTVEEGSGDTLVFIVDMDNDSISQEDLVTTAYEPQAHLLFDKLEVAQAQLLGNVAQGDEIMNKLQLVASTAVAAMQLGVAEEALKRTAEYTSERVQFGRAIGSFQAVALRAADGYIDIEAMRSTYWQAAWRLDQGKDAAAAVHTAKWWASYGGNRIANSAQHMHGGIAADVKYPMHRFFLWAKHHEIQQGSALMQLANLGDLLAEQDIHLTTI